MNGMIGGQVLDLLSEHRRISEDELRLLQKLKTGCLLRAACELGCIAAGKTDEKTLSDARAYGDHLGLAFQIEDDILDIEGEDPRQVDRQGRRERKIHLSGAARTGKVPQPRAGAYRTGGRGARRL